MGMTLDDARKATMAPSVIQHPMHAMVAPIGPAPPPVQMAMDGTQPDMPSDQPSVGRMTPVEQYENDLGSRLMSDYGKDANPYGSPTNHPGKLGKFLHGLSVATGGPNRRFAEEQQFGNTLEGIKKEQSLENEQGAQAENLRSEVVERGKQKLTPLSTESGFENYNPDTGTTTPITDQGGKPLTPFEKPGPLQHIILQGPDGKPQVGFVDPQRGVTYGADGQIIEKPVPFEKDAAEHPVAGMLNGAQKFGLYTPNGWVDPDTKQPLQRFMPAPSFAETGLWQPTEGTDQKGNLIPGKMNERTGQFVPNGVAGGAQALPKDVTAELGKELQTAREADKRLRLMEQNAQSAINGDQQAMLSLVANHIGMTLGAQKGARINQAVWDEAIKSAPFLQNVTKKFDKDGYLEGVTLSPQQVKQMVDLGQVVRDNQWKQVEQTYGNYGINLAPEAQQRLAPRTGNSSAGPLAGAVYTGVGSDGHKYYLDKDHKPIGRAD